MRILKSVLVLLVLSVFPLSAQRFGGGLLAGMTASQVDGDTYSGYNKLGFQGGVFVSTDFQKNFGAQMEIRYAGKGAQKVTSPEDPEVYKLTLHYIDLPLMATYTLKKKVVFDLGFVPGYLFAKNGEDSGGPLPQEFLVKFNKMDIAWLIGVNYRITKNIKVNFRYSYSLMSINDFTDTSAIYTWFGNFVGYHTGDYNNYLTFGFYFQIY
jgi:Outer membrane protein beta-barrel domain